VDGDRERLLDAGTDGYLGKPVRLTDLARRCPRCGLLSRSGDPRLSRSAESLLKWETGAGTDP
jgi:DNA-binding response OmpR family regulator